MIPTPTSYFLLSRAEPQLLGFTQLTNDGLKKSNGLPLLTDGARVYFWEDRGAGMVLASVPVDGGEVAEVSLPPGFWATDISKNGSEFLGNATTPAGQKSLATLPTSGQSLHWLIQPPNQNSRAQWRPDGSWSPDGNKVVFAGLNNVFEARADGSGLRKIADLDGWVSWPRWSPDGRVLCLSVEKPKAEKYRLWGMNADGTGLHPLTFPGGGFTEVRSGEWTPDGKFFVFEAVQAGRHDVWAIRVRDGRFWAGHAKPVRLTSGPLNYHFPLPSRDGEQIFVLGEQTRGELMRFDLKSRAFSDFLGGISAAEVDFSRDGQWVAYVTYPDYTLWRARANGSDTRQLTFPPLEAREPHWSPDGRQIAFQGISHNARFKVYLVSSDGGPIREAVPGGGEESVATWFPDGTSLIYDEPLYRHDASEMFIHRLDLKTGKTYKIPGSGGMWTARLSPDGRYIATLEGTTAANSHHLFVLDATTGRQILTVTMADQLHEPTWSLDSKYVYFAVLDSPAPALYRVGVRDRRLKRIASLKGFPVAGLWTGVAPDASPLLLRDISTEEIYSLHVRIR
jgi:Tol biopolymer transport system component